MTDQSTSITLSQDEIRKLRTRRDQVRTMYNNRNTLFTRYEDIYFMRNIERPKDAGVDKNDWKITASPGGRDKVTGLKRILDTSEIHIKVKGKDGEAQESDKIEAALKTMLRVSGEYKAARNERDTNLAAILYGPVVMTADSVDDLITAKSKDYSGENREVNKYVVKQLESIRKRTPFLIGTINPKESFPEWGAYGLVGHLHEYTMNGAEIKDRWCVTDQNLADDKDYTVSDFFHYEKRLVEAQGVTLFAGEWLTKTDAGEIIGVTNIPVFVRYAGGSTLFHKPEEMLQSFLYSYAKGEWDKRENLFWTYLFTAIYTQGLPGPTVIRDPDDTSDITVDYRAGVKILTMRGKLENVQIIDGDVLQLKNLMDNQTGRSTIQEQTIGGSSEAATYSSYVMEVNAGKLPAIDPTEAQEQCYRDLFLHILQRIKADGIENDLIAPEDIPVDVELEVTMEPDLQQDDLRNAQIVTQLKGSGANVSDEWLNTNLLKIADSGAMFRQKAKEDIRKAVVAQILANQQVMQQFIAAAMGQPPASNTPPDQSMSPGGTTPPGMEMAAGGSTPEQIAAMQAQQGQPGMEQMPKTDAMITPQERSNGNVRPA
jgi:hypothetical protein